MYIEETMIYFQLNMFHVVYMVNCIVCTSNRTMGVMECSVYILNVEGNVLYLQ